MSVPDPVPRPIPVHLELSKKRVVACAQDWPGWCRSGRTEPDALANLAAYAARYAPVAAEAGFAFPTALTPADFAAAARLESTAAYAVMGIPMQVTAADRAPFTAAAADRLARLVEAAWTILDRIAAQTPPELRKGPRGGGRDRDKMVDHVLGAEAAYARKLGVRHRQPAHGDAAAIAALRADILTALRSTSSDPAVLKGWPARYAARRIAWHVLDHAWEMQDRADP